MLLWLKPWSHSRLMTLLKTVELRVLSVVKQSLVVTMFRSCLSPYKDVDEGAGSIVRTLATFHLITMVLLTWFGFQLVPFKSQGNLRGSLIRLRDNEIFYRVLQTTSVLACSACRSSQAINGTRLDCPLLDMRVCQQESLFGTTFICARVNVSDRVVLSYIYIYI